MVKHQRFAMQKTATSRFKAAQRPRQTQKGAPFGAPFCVWCGRWDLNPYARNHAPLKRTRLPIPPRPHILWVWRNEAAHARMLC